MYLVRITIVQIAFVCVIYNLIIRIIATDEILISELLHKSIMNVPESFRQYHHNSLNHTRLRDVRNDTKQMVAFENYIGKWYKALHNKWTDDEAVAVIEHYFWGMSDGICIELGALDGQSQSQSRPLSLDLEWQRIIIEGDPKYRELMAKNSEDAFAVNSAICAEPQVVHYADSGGIMEFMVDNYLERFYPAALAIQRDQWDSLPFATKVSCMPLLAILHHIKVKHVNWFLLDVEGAELTILRSIDFSKIIFDVVAVETERRFRAPENYDQVVALMDTNGYRRSWDQGRNTWFVRKNFTISARPGCIEGSIC